MSPTTSRGFVRARFGTSLVLASSLLLACGGNPAGTTGSGAANLPPQTNPAIAGASASPGQSGPKRTLRASVVDALTGDPVGKAVMFVEGLDVSSTSTPIPAASPDSRDNPANDKTPDEPPAPPADTDGGGGGPVQVAQATTPPGGTPSFASPGLNTLVSPGASPGIVPSASPGASLAPGATPAPGGSPAGSPAPGASGAPTSEKPAPVGTPVPLKSVKADSRGKFELKDLPEGTYAITFWAPGYQAQTFQGGLKSALDVQLIPLSVPKSKQHDLKGVVRNANNDAAGNVQVEATSYKAQLPGAHATSDDAGNFGLSGLLPGNYAVAAWTNGLDGDINTFALVKEVPVAVGREKRTVSPTLVLRAVTSPILLAGTVEGTAKDEDEKKDAKGKAPAPAAKPDDKKPEGVKPQALRAFLRAGDGEIPLATTTIGKDGYFRLRLPQLPDGVSYHLVASGVSADGQTVYLHKYGVTKSDPKLTLQLPDAPGAVTVTERTKGPHFTWEAQDSDVAAYRLSIEDIGQDGETLWEGWTSGTAIQMPASDELKLLKEGESYRYSLTAIKLEGKGAADLTEVASAEWVTSGMSKPATFEVQRTKAGARTTSPAKPLVKPGATAAPPAKPGAKPSAAPSPKSKRAKPMTDL